MFFFYIRIIQIAFIIIMYDVCQVVQLMKCTSQTCFKKIILFKQENSSILDEYSIQYT
jgi:hypothetical protein